MKGWVLRIIEEGKLFDHAHPGAQMVVKLIANIHTFNKNYNYMGDQSEYEKEIFLVIRKASQGNANDEQVKRYLQIPEMVQLFKNLADNWDSN